MANVWKMLFGDKERIKQYPTINPMQQQLQGQLYSGLMGGQSQIPGMEYLQQILSNDPSAFAAYEAPMMRQFNQEIAPGIAENFAGMGAGALGSSAFQQQLAGAGGRLSQDLAAQRANLRSGAMSQLQGMYGMAQQPGFQSYGQPPVNGLVQQLISALISGGGRAAGMGIGNGMMGMMGGM